MATPANENEALQAIEDLGYVEGVATTLLPRGRMQVDIGPLSATGETLYEALLDILTQLTAIPKRDRPDWHEASTRRVVEPHDPREPDKERRVRDLTVGDRG